MVTHNNIAARLRGSLLFCAFLLLFSAVHGISYSAIVTKPLKPSLSVANAKGEGFSPCNYTFNPAWIPNPDNSSKAYVILRVSGCPKEFGGAGDHLIMATCYHDDGHCDDITEPLILPFEASSEDPRVAYWDKWYYLFYYASGSNQSTVYLRKTQTPANVSSWTRIGGAFPWHRNGCLLLRSTLPHYCIFGESPPLPGIGIATTIDFETYAVKNSTLFVPNGASNQLAPEIVIEASTPVVQLSTGDYFHIYSAGTPGWVPNGNYTAGFIILDKNDPSIVVQRSSTHFFAPTTDFELGNGLYPAQRLRTLFPTSIVPTIIKDQFRVWYGAADANVASAIVQVIY